LADRFKPCHLVYFLTASLVMSHDNILPLLARLWLALLPVKTVLACFFLLFNRIPIDQFLAFSKFKFSLECLFSRDLGRPHMWFLASGGLLM